MKALNYLFMMTVPADEAEVMDEVRITIKSELTNIAAKRGIGRGFIIDSVDIKEGIDQISNAMARICTKVKKDKQIIEDAIQMAEFEKAVETEMKAEEAKKKGSK